MEYKGKLYARLGGKMYFDTGKTADDWDALEKRVAELEAENQALRQTDVSGCFFLLSEMKPPKTDSYEVITNKGRVVECRYENFRGNDIWETKYENHNLNEKVVAWRFLK